MGSCVSRRKPSVSKDNQPIINTPDKLDADNYRHHHHHHHHKPENSAVSTAISESERSFANSTPTDAKIAINFFPIDSFPNDTLNLLKGKCNLVELECKNEIKLYISATFTGIYILIFSLNSFLSISLSLSLALQIAYLNVIISTPAIYSPVYAHIAQTSRAIWI